MAELFDQDAEPELPWAWRWYPQSHQQMLVAYLYLPREEFEALPTDAFTPRIIK